MHHQFYTYKPELYFRSTWKGCSKLSQVSHLYNWLIQCVAVCVQTISFHRNCSLIFFCIMTLALRLIMAKLLCWCCLIYPLLSIPMTTTFSLDVCQQTFSLDVCQQSRFSSYLTDRRQAIKIRNCFSDMLPTSYGVPQGSGLGSLLFILYTKLLSTVIKSYSTSCLSVESWSNVSWKFQF